MSESGREYPMTIQDCRPEVQHFAILMEKALQENEGKKDYWHNGPLNLLMMRLQRSWSTFNIRVMDLMETPQALRSCAEFREVQLEVGFFAVDLANLFLFVADRCGLISKKS